jgi:hypothetical protein
MDDDVVVGCLRQGDPRREECAADILEVMRVQALWIITSQRQPIDENEIAQHACIAFTKRIELELRVRLETVQSVGLHRRS